MTTVDDSRSVTAGNPNLYDYSFWPPRPWHEDPDTSQFPTLESMRNPSEDLQNRYLDMKPLIWPTDDDRWRGAYCFFPGSYGMAALYCRLDDTDNIVDVSASP